MINSKHILKKERLFAGDVLSVRYRVFGLLFSFIGIIISVRNNFFFNNSYVIFRNIMAKTAVELSVPFILINYWELRDYAKKVFKYTKSKLLYLRSKKNNNSIIKPF